MRANRLAQSGGTIPIDHTAPGAFDLTVLFNGFKPLFQAPVARRLPTSSPSRSSRRYKAKVRR